MYIPIYYKMHFKFFHIFFWIIEFSILHNWDSHWVLQSEVRKNMLSYTAASSNTVLHLTQGHYTIGVYCQVVEPLSAGINS